MSDQEINIARELASLRGSIDAMVLKDQQDDRVLELVPKLMANLFSLEKALEAKDAALLSHKHAMNEELRVLSDGLNKQAGQVKYAISWVDNLKDVKEQLAVLDGSFQGLANLHREQKKHLDETKTSLNDLRTDQEDDNTTLSLRLQSVSSESALNDIKIKVIESRLESLNTLIDSCQRGLERVLPSIDALRADYESFKSNLKTDQEVFKINVADSITKVMAEKGTILDKKLAEIKGAIAISGVTTLTPRVDMLEADKSILNRKYEVIDRQLATMARNLDEVKVSLKGLQLDKG